MPHGTIHIVTNVKHSHKTYFNHIFGNLNLKNTN